jgi:hypothetical protein
MIRAVLSRCGLTGIFSSGNREEIRSQKCVDKKSWQIVVKHFQFLVESALLALQRKKLLFSTRCGAVHGVAQSIKN